MTAAVVYLPALDRLYTACDHGPALLRRRSRSRASARAGIEGASLLATAPSLAPEHWPGGVPEVKRSFRASLAYRLCLVAEGRFDGMLTLRDAWEWDIAAGVLICERAGAVVTDRTGRGIVFNAAHPQAAGVVAAAPGLHGALMGRLSGEAVRPAEMRQASGGGVCRDLRRAASSAARSACWCPCGSAGRTLWRRRAWHGSCCPPP